MKYEDLGATEYERQKNLDELVLQAEVMRELAAHVMLSATYAMYPAEDHQRALLREMKSFRRALVSPDPEQEFNFAFDAAIAANKGK